MKRILLTCVVSGAFSFAAACDDERDPMEETVEMEDEGAIDEGAMTEETSPAMQGSAIPEADEDALRAVARIEGKSGSDLRGEAFFVAKDEDEVNFGIYLENAPPGTHGVHIHQNGDCSAPDASSAGDHWNPTSEAHGKWGEEPFHLGDIGNVEVDDQGTANMSITTDRWELSNGERSVVGRAIVVHAKADDFATQPDGAAGERIGCGVIEWKQGPDRPTDPPTP